MILDHQSGNTEVENEDMMVDVRRGEKSAAALKDGLQYASSSTKQQKKDHLNGKTVTVTNQEGGQTGHTMRAADLIQEQIDLVSADIAAAKEI